jgi:hypothetical protein
MEHIFSPLYMAQPTSSCLHCNELCLQMVLAASPLSAQGVTVWAINIALMKEVLRHDVFA